MLSSDKSVPSGFAIFSSNYSEDVLLKGGRDSNTKDLPASASFNAGVFGTIPSDTPPGNYFMCAQVDPPNFISELDETNNVGCSPLVVTAQLQQISAPLFIDGPNSVAYQLFSVIDTGNIQAQVTWNGTSTMLTATLEGRRRPALPNPTTPYAQVTSASPLTLNYNVTSADLARGVGWRLVMANATGTFAGAVGTINISTPTNSATQATFDQEKVAMRSGEIWPSAGLHTDFMTSLAAVPGPGQHGIISLTGACDCYQNRDLEASGLHRQSYLPGRHAYGLISKAVDLANPDIAGLVEHISPLEPEDKIDPNVLVGNYAIYGIPAGNFVDNGDGTLELAVLFARDVSVTEAEAILTVEAISHSAVSDHWWQVTLDALDVRDLAAYDEVEWIDPGLMPHIDENDNTRALVGVDALQNATINAGAITYAGLTGNGINVGVDDSGLDTAHPDLNVVGTISPVNPPSSPHGTHVGGIVAGSGANSNQNDANGNPNGGTAFQWRGMAPNAGLIDSSDLINLGNLLNAINNFSLDISNHSHGVSVDGAYDAANQTIDQAIRGGGTSGGNAVPRRPQVYSAGNNGVNPANPGNQRGYFSTTKQMKNAVVVGNWDTGQNDLSRTSSMGPAYDGRIKPELVAPGSNTAPGAANITSTGTTGNANSCYANNLNQGYGPCSGTSMASPAVAGIMALMLEAWEDTYDVDVDDNPPLPSTLKALLIQTATDIVDNDVRSNTLVEIDSDSNGANGNDGAGRATATVGPDFSTGWGLVNASSAVALLQDTRDEGGSVPVPNRIIQDAVNQATVREYDFVVDTMQDIKVTLAWDDMEAAIQNIANGPMLVNDLDLELEAPDGTIYYPWKLGQVIQDNNGVVIADVDQTPGTNITVSLPLNPTQNPAAGNDYIPAGALTGNGTWVAGTGKDHLNNVEQVFVNGAQAGHWTLRVTGFDIQSGFQDFSVVGFPYPDLADLVVYSDDKVGIPGLNEDLTFTFTTDNIGPVTSTVDFEYEVSLSLDFTIDGSDVQLTDTAQASLGPLASGGSVDHTSTVQITQANLDALLGAGSTIDDLLNTDAFLLVQVDSDNEVLEHNETNTTFVQAARLVDVVLVLDKSGSMSGTVTVSNGTETKLEVLQASANMFLDLMRAGAGDELAEISFESSATTDHALQDYDNAARGTVQGIVNGLSDGGGTDIREALQDAVDLLPAANDNRKVIIFFSDGEATAGGDPSEQAFLDQFGAKDVHVYSVGLGTEGGTGYEGLDTELLQLLSTNAESGFFHVTTSALDLDKFFVNAVAGSIESDVIVDPVDTIAPGDTHTVDVNAGLQDYLVTFILTWDDPGENLNLSVKTPAGQIVDASNHGTFGDRVSYESASAYKLMTLRMPIASASNDQSNSAPFEMIIDNPGGTAVNYSASAVTDSTVDAEVTIADPGTSSGLFEPGDSVDFTFLLSQLGGGAVDNGVVSVTPNVPMVDVANLLSSGIVTSVDLAAIPTEINGDELNLQERMVLALQNILGSSPLSRTDLEDIELPETGTDGTYQGSYEETSTRGTYGFTLHADALAEECQPVQRESVQSVTVSSEVDPTDSIVVVTDPGDGTHIVTVTPYDDSGNFIGPGYSTDVSIQTTGILVPASGVDDGLNGSYIQVFRPAVVGVPGLEVVTVTVLGVSLVPVPVDVGSPTPDIVLPGGGGNDSGTTVTIGGGIGIDLSGVIGVTLVGGGGDISVNLGGFGYNATDNVVTGSVPAGLTPGNYNVVLRTGKGKGARSEVFFKVTGKGQDFPDKVSEASLDLRKVLNASSSKDRLDSLDRLVKIIRELPTGPNLSKAEKDAAIKNAAQLALSGKKIILASDVKPIALALNGSKVDARFVNTDPVLTPKGDAVKVLAGNDVEVIYGKVDVVGATKAVFTKGPDSADLGRRGTVHTTVDITTTAGFKAAEGIRVKIPYQDGDFKDEKGLRVFHQENGAWVDRTESVDTENNLAIAKVNSLSPFTIVSGGGDISQPSKTIIRPVAPTSVVSGSTFDVQVVAGVASNLGGAQFALKYDPAVVSVVSAETTDNLKDCLGVHKDDGKGRLSLALACASGHSASPLALWDVTLRTGSDIAIDSFFLTIDEVMLGSGDAPPVAIPGAGEQVTVAIVDGVCGDSNGDGEVNILDVIIDLQLSGGGTPTDSQRILADLNRDGKVNVLDAVIALQHIVGLAPINGCGVTDTQSFGTITK